MGRFGPCAVFNLFIYAHVAWREYKIRTAVTAIAADQVYVGTQLIGEDS